jgi:hypothetical protein
VLQGELPGTEIWVREDTPASEVEIVGEEEPQAEQVSPELTVAAPAEAPAEVGQPAAEAPGEAGAEAPAEDATLQGELPGTEILVSDEPADAEVEIVGEEQLEEEQPETEQ